MAIRPTDIQGAIWQASQAAPLTQRAEEAPRIAQAAAQAAFAAHTAERQETVAETSRGEGNRVEANPERSPDDPGAGGKRKRARRGGFAEVVDEAAGLDEPAHLIDVSA